MDLLIKKYLIFIKLWINLEENDKKIFWNKKHIKISKSIELIIISRGIIILENIKVNKDF